MSQGACWTESAVEVWFIQFSEFVPSGCFYLCSCTVLFDSLFNSSKTSLPVQFHKDGKKQREPASSL